MMRQLHALPSKSLNHVSTGLRADEAEAVLTELKRQAEQRMLDACREFQDIAFEMEWRLADWQSLQEQRTRLIKEADKIGALPSRFNVSSRKRTGKVPRDAAWQRLARAYRRKLENVEKKLTESAAAIMTRNEEGSYLEQEISLLQQRAERITRVLGAGKKRVRVVRGADDASEALARLALELSLEPDVADLDVLINAYQAIEQRRGRHAAG